MVLSVLSKLQMLAVLASVQLPPTILQTKLYQQCSGRPLIYQSITLIDSSRVTLSVCAYSACAREAVSCLLHVTSHVPKPFWFVLIRVQAPQTGQPPNPCYQSLRSSWSARLLPQVSFWHESLRCPLRGILALLLTKQLRWGPGLVLAWVSIYLSPCCVAHVLAGFIPNFVLLSETGAQAAGH